MYQRLLLVSNAALQTMTALRQGALIARACNASAHLLIIEPTEVGAVIADGSYPMQRTSHAQSLLDFGLDRLKRLGIPATGEVGTGEPIRLIAAAARRFGADLIVVGHRRQSFIERWWSGPSEAYIIDQVSCSVMIARDTISDAEFESLLASADA